MRSLLRKSYAHYHRYMEICSWNVECASLSYDCVSIFKMTTVLLTSSRYFQSLYNISLWHDTQTYGVNSSNNHLIYNWGEAHVLTITMMLQRFINWIYKKNILVFYISRRIKYRLQGGSGIWSYKILHQVLVRDTRKVVGKIWSYLCCFMYLNFYDAFPVHPVLHELGT